MLIVSMLQLVHLDSGIKKMEKRIAIIGAGISGLLACKHMLEKGFEPVVFEARNCIGGVWSQTIESTKLQTPKSFYQFSDFEWPTSVNETFPDHNQVLQYIQTYAVHFNLLPRIKFNSKVISIDYVGSSDQHMLSWDSWGGTSEPYSSSGRWNVTVENAQDGSTVTEIHEVDFLILCIGKYSDLPNVPDFILGNGPEVFDGQVLHSMDYAAMNGDCAADFVRNKRVAVIGFQKSAIDLATEVAGRNGAKHPCTLIFRRVHWTVPEYLLVLTFNSLNRSSQILVHKPGEGFLRWLFVLSLSPLLWTFSKLVECYLKWIYPLKKYNTIPEHNFLKQIYSCSLIALPAKFYDRVKEGSLILKRSHRFSFCRRGLLVDGEDTPVEADIVIFATGYKGDQKLKNIFQSSYLQKCIVGSSLPFYRECIHPRIPQLAILGYADSPSVLHNTEIRSKWLAHFLAGKFKLPSIKEMEGNVKKWEEIMRWYANESYRRSCLNVLLQIYCHDQLCNDMGYNSRRKSCLLAELFAPHYPNDYRKL